MSDEALIERMARGMLDKTMTEEEAREYARGALAELRNTGYAVVKTDDIGEIKRILLGTIAGAMAETG